MTPAEIAARLTPAQKRALLWLREDGGWRQMPASTPLRPVARRIQAQGLAETGSGWRATPLGLAVRAIVERETRDE